MRAMCGHLKCKTVAEVRSNGDGSKVVRIMVKCDEPGCGVAMRFPELRYLGVESEGLVAVLECVPSGD